MWCRYVTFAIAVNVGLVSVGWAQGLEQQLVIVVNKANPVENLPLADLRKIFLGEQRHWENGEKITVVMRNPGQSERIAMLQHVYKMSETDFARYFLKATFTGMVSSAPKVFATPVGVRKFVRTLPGAIGYLRASELDQSVKPVRVDGHLPGEAGYPLPLLSTSGANEF
ncbi:MAG: hypothetical protein EXR78_02945 [Deltaproteobacteria bacterium]|nr:hypothetical protein [Deltaproteobacteria bacterium]